MLERKTRCFGRVVAVLFVCAGCTPTNDGDGDAGRPPDAATDMMVTDADLRPPDAAPAEDGGPSADGGVDDGPILFVIAGQSNAEGNVFLPGLRALAAAVPPGAEPLTDEQRQASRVAVSRSLGSFCGVPPECVDDPEACEEPVPFSHATADATVDALRATALDWRAFDADYQHPSVEIRAAQFHFAPVELEDADGQWVDNEECAADPDATTRVGPTLDRYSPAEWAPLAPGFGMPDPDVGLTYGPELGFGAAIAEAFPGAHILKVAMGGSSLGDHWRLDGPLYAALLDETRAALDETGARLGGLVWFQGFNDQFEDAWCAPLTPGYEARLSAFLQAVRGALDPALPVVIVKARADGGLVDIRAAQDAVAAALPGIARAESAGLSDCFHYDSGSQIVIGERTSDAMLELLRGR